MDVELPNGKILSGVPEGTSKEDIMSKAISSGVATPSDFGIQEGGQFDKFLQSTESMGKKSRIEQLASDVSAPEALAISAGKGLYDIGRGTGLVDPASDIEKQAYKELEKQRPVSTFIGETVGQSAPFVLPASAAGLLPNAAARVGASTLIGATEGGVIANAEDQSAIKGAGIGGTIAGATEVFFPILGRVSRKVWDNVIGGTPKGALVDKQGQPSPEMQSALDSAGLTWGDMQKTATDMLGIQKPGADPTQAARAAGFEQIGAPYSKGQITKDFAQRKQEQALLESTEPAADAYRGEMLRQSDAFKGELDGIVDGLGVSNDVGVSLKEALTSRKKMLRENKNNLYKKLGEETENLEMVPVLTDGIFSAIPDAGTVRRVGILSPNQSEAVKDLLIEYGVDQSAEAMEQAAKKGIETNMLSISNFEDFRVALNAIEKSDISGAISNVTSPIKKALDDEIDIATKNLESAGGDIAQIAKDARSANALYKTEFDQAKITSKLIDSVKRGSTQPKIEASNAYNKVMAKGVPIEDLERVMQSLGKEGALGKKAIKEMQAKAVMDLVDSAFSAQSRQIQGTRVFGATPYSKQYEALKPKFDVLFNDDPKTLSRLDNLYNRAQDIIPPSGAVPKGSSGFFIDVLMRTGLYSIMSKFPAAGPVLELFRTMGEKASDRKLVDKALNAKPDVKATAYRLDRDYPQIAASLGIAGISKEQEETE